MKALLSPTTSLIGLGPGQLSADTPEEVITTAAAVNVFSVSYRLMTLQFLRLKQLLHFYNGQMLNLSGVK